jgi:hypothetical protein
VTCATANWQWPVQQQTDSDLCNSKLTVTCATANWQWPVQQQTWQWPVQQQTWQWPVQQQTWQSHGLVQYIRTDRDRSKQQHKNEWSFKVEIPNIKIHKQCNCTAKHFQLMSLHMCNVLYISTGLLCNAVTFSMSGNCDFPCREVHQYVIQICKCYCTAVPTPSHIAGVTLQTDKAVIL